MYDEFDTKPNVITSALMGIILLSLLILIGFVLLFPQPMLPFLQYVYPFVAILILSILGARGRFDTPTPLQYLLAFGIALFPIIGTLYVAYYAGIIISRYRVFIYSLVSMFLLVTFVILFQQVDLGSITKLAGIIDESTTTPLASSTSATEPISPLTIMPKPTTAEEISADTPTSEPPACSKWSDITLDNVGQELCVYGEYQSTYIRSDGTDVLIFSEDAGSFNIWSNPKPMSWYLENIQGKCIMVKGKIITSGVRPIILLGSRDFLSACP